MLRTLSAIFVLMIGAFSALSQQTTPPTKAQLIGQFAGLTKANRIDIDVQLSLDDVSKSMAAIIDDEKDLADAQREELRGVAKEIFSRLTAQTEKTLTENQMLAKLGEQVITDVYNKSFTEAELSELISFFKTPLGQKAVDFLATSKSQIEQDFRFAMQAKIEEVTRPIIGSSLAELRRRVKDIKKK